MKDRLGMAIGVAAAVLIGACGGGNSTGGNVTANVGGVSWHSTGKGFIITAAGSSTTFDIQAATPFPNSSLIDSSKPQLLIVFQQVPSVGTYGIDGVTVVVEYQADTNTVYSTSNGTVQIASISTSRAQGAFNFELQSPVADPMVLTVTDGAFDIPVSAH